MGDSVQIRKKIIKEPFSSKAEIEKANLISTREKKMLLYMKKVSLLLLNAIFIRVFSQEIFSIWV